MGAVASRGKAEFSAAEQGVAAISDTADKGTKVRRDVERIRL